MSLEELAKGLEMFWGERGDVLRHLKGQRVEEGVDGSVWLRGTELGLVTKEERELVSHH